MPKHAGLVTLARRKMIAASATGAVVVAAVIAFLVLRPDEHKPTAASAPSSSTTVATPSGAVEAVTDGPYTELLQTTDSGQAREMCDESADSPSFQYRVHQL